MSTFGIDRQSERQVAGRVLTAALPPAPDSGMARVSRALRSNTAPLAGLFLVAVMSACAPAKPNGSEYLGKWNATDKNFVGVEFTCQLAVSKNGESFLVSIEGPRRGDMCRMYEGIYTLTAEGNMKGGRMGMVVFSYDKQADRMALSAPQGVQYLTKNQ